MICAYLERTHPEPRLYPTDSRDFALALWYEEYGDTRLAETAGTVFFQRIVRPLFFKEATDDELVQQALTEGLPPIFDYLERQITAGASGRDGLVGNRFSIADIAICSPLVNLQLAGEPVDATRWPALSAYLSTMCARPAFTRVLAREQEQARAA